MPTNNCDSAHGQSGRHSASQSCEEPGLSWSNLTDFYCNFFDLINAMAIVIDNSGAIRMFNRKAEELTGYSREDVSGQDFFYMFLPEHSHANAMGGLIRNMTGGKAPQALPLPILSKTGARLPVSWSISVVNDDDGRMFGILWLGFIPGPATRGTELSYASDPFYTYVGSMTHDLLNHSQVAMGYLELAMERADGDEKLHCMLDRASKAVKKCGEIAGNVHKLSYGTGLNGHFRMTSSDDERRD